MHAVTLLAPAASVEALSDLLSETLDALSVSVEDADAGTADEQPVFDEPGQGPTGEWQRARLVALFEDERSATAAAAAVSASSEEHTAVIVAIEPVPDDDWVRKSQSQFGPTEISAGFWIVPSWCEPRADASRVIRLDPGRAFGTGTHPTTQMCLRWIATHAPAHARRWQRVLDYGAGSGVLAIAAGLFGAVEIDAVDLDPAAVEAAALNAASNGIAVRSGLPELASGRYALVLANILATPLKLLAPLLSSLLEPGGTLVLSGILERQAGELREAYAPHLAIDVVAADDGWVLMTGSAFGPHGIISR